MRSRFILVLLFALTSPCLPGQVVQIGPSDPNFCEKTEQLTPNLRVSDIARISGTVVDETGAPFKVSRVELRIYISAKQQTPVKTAITDEQGQYDLGLVEPGQYRLLASATRAFAQPQSLACTVKRCNFNFKLRANSTDMLTSVCPVRES